MKIESKMLLLLHPNPNPCNTVATQKCSCAFDKKPIQPLMTFSKGQEMVLRAYASSHHKTPQASNANAI